ncbi:TIGR02996 domain-containing protein [Zavarzinella formosa]|uniref:TIGR02996 domain-containing protein n=1 Tax=Zavarzinella formosa TaxID=360055 RepID=UPI0002EDCD76|nr:TIGR02996 domain-containing protein [Zavarzinella formosa]
MNEGKALYQSILENPEDDAPRLIYSDWLEEQGDSQRAAFIRAQCELARAEPYSPLFRKLTAKSRRLFQPHWLHTLRGKVLNAEMRRGFIHKITIYSKRFVLDGGEIFDIEPIREVKFADFSAVRGNVPVATLAICPHLKRLTGLTVNGYTVTGRMFDELLDGGNLRALKKLAFDNTRIESVTYPKILSKSRLPVLEELRFDQMVAPGADYDWLRGLALADILSQLRTCLINADSCSYQSSNEFIQLPALSKLERFALVLPNAYRRQSLPLELSLLYSMTQTRHLGNLKDLDLAMSEITDTELQSFAANTQFQNLRRLNLPMNHLTGDGVQAILNAEHLRGLYYLNLDANHITGKSKWKEQLRKWCPEAIVRVN